MKLKLHWQIFIAMALGAVFAFSLGEKALIAAPLGTIFFRLLKMIIVPLVLTSITTAVARMGGDFGRVGAKTFGYYLLTSMLAIVLGLVLANSIRPGAGIELSTTGEVFDKSSLTTPESLIDFIIRIIPTNVLGAAASGDILGIIFWSIIFGFVITRLPPKPKEFLTNLFDYSFQAVMILTRGVIRLAPIGVFGLINKAVATSGLELFRGVAMYMVTITAGLTIHLFVILPLVLFLFTRLNPIKHFQAMTAAMITAFSTSSSGATLPVTMECVRENAGVSDGVTRFVLPIGATVNMDGTALYECAGVLFIAQALGFDLSLSTQLLVVITAFFASVGAAAVPSAGLVMIFIVLNAIGLGDNESAALLVGTMLAVDRPLDMYRTVVNIYSDSIGAAVIAHSEGEELTYPMAMEESPT